MDSEHPHGHHKKSKSESEPKSKVNPVEKLVVIFSWLLVILTFPFSLIVVFKSQPTLDSKKPPFSWKREKISFVTWMAWNTHKDDRHSAQTLNLTARRRGVILFKWHTSIRQYQRVIIFRNGRLMSQKAFGPGLIFYLPCVDELRYVDLRTIVYCVPLQEALTKDALTVTVDAVVFYRVFKPVDAILKIADADAATQLLAQTSLRNAIGTRLINDLLSDRQAIGAEVFDNMKESTSFWGINVMRVEIKEVCMPLELQRAMAAEAESSRLANAKIIVADSEIEATKNLDKATELLSSNPYSMQLRYLQSLHTIAGDKTHTYVIPIAPKLYKNIFH